MAISYDPPETLKAFTDRFGITYPLLSDVGSPTIRRFGILNTVAEEAVGPNKDDPDVAADVLKYVSEVGASERMVGIAYPGTFMLDPDGTVTSRHFEVSYIERNTVAQVQVSLNGSDSSVTGTRVTTDQVDVTTYTTDEAVAPAARGPRLRSGGGRLPGHLVHHRAARLCADAAGDLSRLGDLPLRTTG